MSWVKFSAAVVLTSAALVVALFATGAALAGNALANGLQMAAQRGPGFGPGGPGGPGGWNLPPELASLKDVPAGERFAHFKGVNVNLTDKDGKPIALTVTPGVATSVSATSLTIAGNDGASHTYALNDQTMSHGKAVANGGDVVVLTIDNSPTATAVVGANPTDWGHH
jgi:hypothetical protein